MRIGVLCSGGDAPGMNACLRAVVRSAISAGHDVIGLRHGYQGLSQEGLVNDSESAWTLDARSVAHIVQHGGTMLHSSRCQSFASQAGRERAAENLRRLGIDALIPIGGDGTLRGAAELAAIWTGQIIGCPATIDNDVIGTDFTIGFSTAVETAVNCIDKLRDTAESHQRLFLVEVMGRHSGYLALYTAVAAGAEVACVPEVPVDAKAIVELVSELKRRGKQSFIVVVSEGGEQGGAAALSRQLEQAGCEFPTRSVALGHIQRGGTPTPADRILGTQLGDFAVQSILDGATGMMAGQIDGELVLSPLARSIEEHKPLPNDLVELLRRMSC
ncbi:ATP-dependent 6-phosphofructokinase [Roseimaritima sediminicola]|uniref:ATP-dependent 6-phosphofructokinase n=1 Tax=Roseimaritima sediminicola TaxID=2662066 RepID=UPI001298588E|nr:ATP-dependent 6-phosphofructokinase [Roseimaritima sediminicola]